MSKSEVVILEFTEQNLKECIEEVKHSVIPEKPRKIIMDVLYDRLNERCISLPCKVGDKVWFLGDAYEVRKIIIDETGISSIQIAKKIEGVNFWNSFTIDDIGKTIFLTQKEAEQN